MSSPLGLVLVSEQDQRRHAEVLYTSVTFGHKQPLALWSIRLAKASFYHRD